MRGFFIAPQKNKFYRGLSGLIACVLSLSLIFSPTASYAQSINLLNLPVPGTMIAPSPAFAPVLLKGMTIHPDDPLKFDFIIDSGNTDFTTDQIKQESEKLVKYFLASMTIPKDDLWVNLSPYEDDRIIPEELGKTELGRDMLAQDYILKQLTASLMYPEKELGKKFWDRIYQRAEEEFGTSEIPVNTFNKVWILPERATVYEHEQTVYVVDARLKVMLDSDYQAMQYEKENGRLKMENGNSNFDLQSSIIKEIIIPEIEREVNEGQHFAPLRQIYHSLILAKWYKETVKNGLLSQVYADRNMIDGVNVDDETIKDQIYAQYMEAYKKGVFDYIKEDYDRLTQQVIPRKYFSGGIPLASMLEIDRSSEVPSPRDGGHLMVNTKVIGKKDGASSPVDINEVKVEGHIKALGSKDPSTRKEAAVALSKLDVIQNQMTEKKKGAGLDSSENNKTSSPINFKKGFLGLWEAVDLWPEGKYNSRLDDPDSLVRLEAIKRIGSRNKIKFISEVIKKFGDDNKEVREIARKVANDFGAIKEQIGEGHISALESNDASARKEAAEALGNLGDIGAVESLIKGLGDKDWSVRLAVVEALGKLKDKRAIGPVGEKLGDENVSVRRAAEKALDEMEATKEQMIEGYGKALGSYDLSAREEADKKSVELGETKEQIATWYIKVFGNYDVSVRKGAIEAVVKRVVGDADVVELLTKELENKNVLVRRTVVEVLGEPGVKDPHVDELLIERLGDENVSVREAAEKALVKREVPKERIAAKHIEVFCSSHGFFVKKGAIEALVKLEKEGAPVVKLLNKRLKDEKVLSVRSTIAEVLAEVEKRKNNISDKTSSPILLGKPGKKVGGIDMNEIDVDRQGVGVNIQFDPVQVQEIMDMGITGFAPVIINITPLPSVLPLLGLEPARRDEEFEISRK